MRVLLTNDDGYRSPGLAALAFSLAGAGHEVVVVAPERDMSGSGTGIGRLRPDQKVDAQPVTLPGTELVGYAVSGPPGLAVLGGVLGAFGDPPDVVVAGINAGSNLGRTVVHSGTVGAALTAQTLGLSGLAVSLAPSRDWQWKTAAAIAASVLPWLCDRPRRTVANLNVPGRADVAGTRLCPLDDFGSLRLATTDPGRLDFELAQTETGPRPGSDRDLVAQGYATVTLLTGIGEASTDSDVPPPLGEVPTLQPHASPTL